MKLGYDKKQRDSFHVRDRRVCFPVVLSLSMRATVSAESCFVLVNTSVRKALALERPNRFDCLSGAGQRASLYHSPMLLFLMIIDFFLHCLEEQMPIRLFLA